MKKGKIVIAGLAAVAAAAMIGGTWAVWTQQLTTRNEFMTGKYSTLLRENFDEENAKDRLPGDRTKKEVWVANEGTVPVIAKITLSQEWFRPRDMVVTTRVVREEGENEPLEEETTTLKMGPVPSEFQARETGSPQWEYAALWNFNSKPGEEVMVLASNRAGEKGPRLNGLTEIQNLKEAEGHWLLMSEIPDELGRYSFYYMGLVPPASLDGPGRTPLLLEGVTINPLLEKTVTGSNTYFEKDPAKGNAYKRIAETTINQKYGENGGYDGCDYSLIVSAQTMQATDGALQSIISGESISSEEIAIRDYLVDHVTEEGGEDHSGSVKKLLFEESNSRMTYTPYRLADGSQESGNWFMSFTNMVPGGKYKDRLQIENAGFKNYRLYMKAVPVDGQGEIPDKLLEKITMVVRHQGNIIYEGNATGYKYLQEGEQTEDGGAVPLGLYRRGDKGEITVELQLAEDIGIEYANVLALVDWQFMVQEVPTPSGGGGSSGGGGGSRGGGTTTTTISEGTVPLTDMIPDENVPMTALIPDESVPLAFLPKTGDVRPIFLLGMVAVISLFLFAVLGAVLKREKEKEES